MDPSSQLDFYSTAAQVMPVFFIALVLETVRRDRKPVRTSLGIICLAAAVAEAICFQVLANRDPSALKATVVAECLWIAGVFLLLRILLDAFSAVATDEGERDDTTKLAVGGMVLLLVGMTAIPFL